MVVSRQYGLKAVVTYVTGTWKELLPVGTLIIVGKYKFKIDNLKTWTTRISMDVSLMLTLLILKSISPLASVITFKYIYETFLDLLVAFSSVFVYLQAAFDTSLVLVMSYFSELQEVPSAFPLRATDRLDFKRKSKKKKKERERNS